MNLLACLTVPLFALILSGADANTEKVVFLAPPPANIPNTLHHLDALKLDILSPANSKLRKSLPVAFPTDEQPYGLASWYLLQNLKSGQRHEVRVCWAAIQPTEFDLDVFTAAQVAEDHGLLEAFLLTAPRLREESKALDSSDGHISFLRIRSAADFFTTNKTLMRSPPPVDVDIILDPFLANIFPRSLVPTAVYIVTLLIVSWFASGVVWSYLVRDSNQATKDHVD